MSDASGVVLRLDAGEVASVVDVLCESFFDYPVMRWVLAPASGGYADLLRDLLRYFVTARVIRDEALLGIGRPGRLDAAALVSRPGGLPSPPELAVLREELWGRLGREARVRYEAFGAAGEPLQVDAPHLHLNMVGVRAAARGRGLGGRLLEFVHEMSSDDATSLGVTLNTEDEANVPLYEHFGYRLVGATTFGPGLRTWGFFRPDRDQTSPS